MNREPYARGLVSAGLYVEKACVSGSFKAVLDGALDDRGLRLISPISRVLVQGEIHELISTDDEAAAPGRLVDRIGYVGFFQVDSGGVAIAGDSVTIDGNYIGDLVGFDETHFPNHINVVVRGPIRVTGRELNLQLGHAIRIERTCAGSHC